MLAVVRGLESAGIGAGLGGVTLRLAEWEIFVSHVGVVAIAVIRSIDRAAEFSGTAEAVDCRWWGVLVIC